MTRIISLFILLLPATLLFGQDTLRPVTAATYRSGLPNFFARLKKHEPVRVAYLGGSITRADGGWREQTFRWLKDRYPTAQFREIMAAIGGTGSDFGAYRVGDHVLRHKPDLVFVEFAVNDHGKPAQYIKESMEGIVRQIRRDNATIDICFVYTFSKPQLEFYERGRFPVSASAMEVIADHYQLPSICMALPAVKQVLEGSMVMQGKPKESPDKPVFSEDGVHPLNGTGQKIYAEAVALHLTALEPVGTAGARKLPAPLMPNNLEHATMVSIDKAERSSGWQTTDSVVTGKAFSSFLSTVYASADTTDFIRFSTKGTSFGIVDVLGPDSGQLVVRVDNDPPRYIDRFDAYCTYYRMNYYLVTGLPDGTHSVTIRVSPRKLDKAAILKKRNNTITDPALYGKQTIYLGGLLLQK
nr:SGNH/GDSL hydrolase family protein [uncultured Arsenicibacter sp.]